MPRINFKFACGDTVRDKVTNFEGVVTAQTNNYIGCVQYCVEARVDKPGAESKAYWLDEARLERLPTPKPSIEKDARRPGGPRTTAR